MGRLHGPSARTAAPTLRHRHGSLRHEGLLSAALTRGDLVQQDLRDDLTLVAGCVAVQTAHPDVWERAHADDFARDWRLTRLLSPVAGEKRADRKSEHQREEDERVEVTPKSIRIRKAILDPNDRKKFEKSRNKS